MLESIIDSDLTLQPSISRIICARGKRGTSGVCSTTTRAKRSAEPEPKQFSTPYQRCTRCAVSVGMNTRHISDGRGHPLPIVECLHAATCSQSSVLRREAARTKRAHHPTHVNMREQPGHRIKIMQQCIAMPRARSKRGMETES